MCSPTYRVEPFSLGQRAAYRRVLAVLKAQSVPFVVAGALGLSMYVGQALDGELEVLVHPINAQAMLAALSAAGFRVHSDEDRGDATIEYAGSLTRLAWRMPPPLGGDVDEAWFSFAVRRHVLGLRVRVAPPEELLWARIATPKERAGLPDPLVDALLLEQGAALRWDRLLGRLAGLEALTLAHIYLFRHRHPEARARVPREVLDTLEQRVNSAAGESVESSIH
jgi:hypothetical protein